MKYYSRSGGDHTYAVEKLLCKLLNIDCYSLATNLLHFLIQNIVVAPEL